jgi:hypothetical protein
VLPDEVLVEARTVGHPPQPGPVMGPAGGQELGGEEVPVATEGGADEVAGDVGQLGPPRRFPVPLWRPGHGRERVAVER